MERSIVTHQTITRLFCLFVLLLLMGSNVTVTLAQEVPPQAQKNIPSTDSNSVQESRNIAEADQKENLEDAVTQGNAPSTVRKEQPWYRDPDYLSAFAGVGALIISLLAIIISQSSSREQKIRQKREELRMAIERLVSLREEFNDKFNKTIDVGERTNLSMSSKTKTDIYLQTAEALEKDIPGHVSTAEYMVLASENSLDSDFKQAREYYQKAVEASERGSSITTKQVARRGLAMNYFAQQPRNVSEGRRYFKEALSILEEQGESDYYSLYGIARTYREWGYHEAWVGNGEEAHSKYKEAFRIASGIPDWYSLKHEEMRFIANSWRWLGNGHFVSSHGKPVLDPNLDGAREAYEMSLEVLQPLNDDNTADLRGQIYQDWAYNEILYGSVQSGEDYFALARQNLSNLPINYPNREVRLRAIDWALATAKEKRNNKEKTPLEKPPGVQDMGAGATSLEVAIASPYVPSTTGVAPDVLPPDVPPREAEGKR